MPSSVLVIDDDRALAKAICERLESAGFDTRHASCGTEGIREATREVPDVVILDIRMPDIDGIEVCTTLRRKPGLAHTPIMFLTADAGPAFVKQAREAGGDYFMAKPYRGMVLARFVRRLAESPSQRPPPEEGILRLSPPAHTLSQESSE